MTRWNCTQSVHWTCFDKTKLLQLFAASIQLLLSGFDKQTTVTVNLWSTPQIMSLCSLSKLGIKFAAITMLWLQLCNQKPSSVDLMEFSRMCL